jgi:serine/threonine protein kinase
MLFAERSEKAQSPSPVRRNKGPADGLKKGALPLDEALRYAVEIADALEKAHRQGVIHRDLKPSNFASDDLDHAISFDSLIT